MKLAKYLKWVLLGISAILLVVFFLLPHNSTSDAMVDTYICWAYILVAITLILVLAFLLIDVSKSKKSLISFLAIIVGAVIFAVPLLPSSVLVFAYLAEGFAAATTFIVSFVAFASGTKVTSFESSLV